MTKKQIDFKIEAKLDLHGKTLQEAFDLLKDFLVYCKVNNKRRLLIITGKGVGGEGILRTKVPRWLETFPDISQVKQASLKHGGEGAFYVWVRK